MKKEDFKKLSDQLRHFFRPIVVPTYAGQKWLADRNKFEQLEDVFWDCTKICKSYTGLQVSQRSSTIYIHYKGVTVASLRRYSNRFCLYLSSNII